MSEHKKSKRKSKRGAAYFLRRFLLSTAGRYLGASAGLVFWQSNDEARNFRITHCDVAIDSLARRWDGARIALMTDLHIGRWVKFDLAEKWFSAVKAQLPDIILLGGDYGRFSNSTGRKFGAMLATLAKTTPCLAIWGNHDYFHNRHRMLEKIFRDAGVQVLKNHAKILRRGDDELIIAGLDDVMHGKPDLHSVFSHVRCSGGRRPATILLCHNPDAIQLLDADAPVDLVLAGHTHGGQIRLPIIADRMAPVVSRKYIQGLIQDDNLKVYVSAGLGVVGLPIRFRCPPELPIITLRSSAQTER